MLREEGFASLYKGFIPKVLRLAPGGGVLLLVVEFTLGVFRQGAFFDSFSFHFMYLLIVIFSSWASVYLEHLDACGGVYMYTDILLLLACLYNFAHRSVQFMQNGL